MGRSVRSVSYWSKHLVKEDNDRAEIKEIRGLGADNLADGLLEMQSEAERFTKAENGMWHVHIDPPADVRLTESQWDRCFSILEEARGIPPGQPRIVVEHEKEGRVHRHAIYARFDPEHMRVWDDAHDAPICHRAARQMAEELGLKRTIGPYDKDRDGPPIEKGPKTYETFRGQRSGIDPRDVKAEVTAIFRESQNPADFIHGLRQHGYELAKGDKRDYCIVDQAGDDHSLARRLSGVNTKQLREFMKDFDRDSLLTVEQARASQRQRLHEQHLSDLATVRQEIAWEEALARAAIQKEQVEAKFVEPTEKNVRDQSKINQVWPIGPPRSEPTTTSPKFGFERAASDLNRAEEKLMPEDLKGVPAMIWTAYQNSATPKEFFAALDNQNVRLAAVTTAEADRSHRNADFAHQISKFSPRYNPGEIVAVTEKGKVHKLDQYSTGESPTRVERFLKPLDRTQLYGVDKTKEFLKSRAQQNTLEVQAFRDLLRDAKQEERVKDARDIDRTETRIRARDKELKPLNKIAMDSGKRGLNVLGGAFVIGDKVAAAIVGVFDPVQTPAQRHEGQMLKKQREADAERQLDLSNEVADAAKRQQSEQAQSRDDIERDW